MSEENLKDWTVNITTDKPAVAGYIRNRDFPLARFNRAVFSNCQNWVIGNFGALIRRVRTNNQDLKKVILHIRKLISCDKNVLVVDIDAAEYEQIKDELKFIVATPYVNLTTSKMVICLIDLRD